MVEVAPAPPLVEIDAVSVRLSGVSVLDDVCLEIAPGTVHALVGPNGGGKSTLLRALLGELPFEGRITRHWRGSGRVGYVPQRLPIDPTLPLTVTDFLWLAERRWPVWAAGARRRRRLAETRLSAVGLDGLAERPLAELSGGERQRLMLSLALTPAPELLLLDEPTAGVDLVAREAVLSALTAVRAAGGTVLLISHDLDLVRRLADRVSVLNRQLRDTGEPAQALAPERLLAAFAGVGA